MSNCFVRRIRASNGEYFIFHQTQEASIFIKPTVVVLLRSVHSFVEAVFSTAIDQSLSAIYQLRARAFSDLLKMQSYSVLHSASLPFAFLCHSLLAGLGNH